MKRLIAALIGLMLISGIGGCAKTESGIEKSSEPISTSTPEPVLSEEQNTTDANWDLYNERAEAFVTAMAEGDFNTAADMFDTTMKQAMPVSTLQNDFWNIIVQQAGEFIDVQEIENLMADEYYICFVTSKHELRGVKLRVVFSKDALVSGLFIDAYPISDGEAVQHKGFTDFPVVVGEGTDFPLNGILSIPDDVTARIPAVVLVHGSGPHDMDETIYANKPFRDIAEYLASNGIAVIRYDKRTLAHGASMAQQFGGSLTVKEETIDDAILAAEILKNDSRIDENKVFILGHSLGGMLAPRIHAEGGNFAGIISLAGSPRSLLDISYDQQMAYIEEMPDGEDKTAALSQMETYDEQVDALMNLSEEEAKNTSMPGGIFVYYFKEMEEHPVSEYIENISVPFLILQGSKDFQVYPDIDFAMWQELLEKRENAVFILYEGLNHLFMTSTGKNISEYQEEYKNEESVDGQVLLDITEWIKEN